METQSIEIPLNKSKLMLLLLAAIVFVAGGIWLVTDPPVQTHQSLLRNPTTIFIIGLASILFFSVIGVFIFKKLFDKSPGLIVSEAGVFDNTSGFSAGFVPWSDVVEIKEAIIANQTLLNLVVKNPQDYIDRQKSAFKKAALQMNYDSYGTVIGITASSLKYKYSELKSLLDRTFADYKRKHATS